MLYKEVHNIADRSQMASVNTSNISINIDQKLENARLNKFETGGSLAAWVTISWIMRSFRRWVCPNDLVFTEVQVPMLALALYISYIITRMKKKNI